MSRTALALSVASLASLATLTAAPALAAPIAWELDPAHSAATFSVKHMMVATVRGEFGKVSGTVTVDGGDWRSAIVEASIDAATINTREPKRDAHLKSPDFFDVAKHPTITFKSRRIEAAAGGRWRMTGDLTIRGIAKPVTFDVEPLSKEWKNPGGATVVGTSATAKVNRKDWGLVWNKPLDAAGGMLVGDDVTITLDVELVKKAPPQAAAK